MLSSAAGAAPAVRLLVRVIWEPSAPYNARRRHRTTCWPDTAFLPSGMSNAGVGDIAEWGLVLRSGRMIATGNRAPSHCIDRRKIRVPPRARMHMGDLHAIGKRHGLFE